jgi:nitrogen regulatory protein P-II 2
MKIIMAIIQPFRLDKVIDALEEIENFPGVTVSDARGFGRLKSESEQHAPHFDPFHKKVRLEIAAPDEIADEIADIIAARAHTGNHGDGKIFVWTIDNAIRDQTGETGEKAL